MKDTGAARVDAGVRPLHGIFVAFLGWYLYLKRNVVEYYRELST